MIFAGVLNRSARLINTENLPKMLTSTRDKRLTPISQINRRRCKSNPQDVSQSFDNRALITPVYDRLRATLWKENVVSLRLLLHTRSAALAQFG